MGRPIRYTLLLLLLLLTVVQGQRLRPVKPRQLQHHGIFYSTFENDSYLEQVEKVDNSTNTTTNDDGAPLISEAALDEDEIVAFSGYNLGLPASTQPNSTESAIKDNQRADDSTDMYNNSLLRPVLPTANIQSDENNSTDALLSQAHPVVLPTANNKQMNESTNSAALQSIVSSEYATYNFNQDWQPVTTKLVDIDPDRMRAEYKPPVLVPTNNDVVDTLTEDQNVQYAPATDDATLTGTTLSRPVLPTAPQETVATAVVTEASRRPSYSAINFNEHWENAMAEYEPPVTYSLPVLVPPSEENIVADTTIVDAASIPPSSTYSADKFGTDWQAAATQAPVQTQSSPVLRTTSSNLNDKDYENKSSDIIGTTKLQYSSVNFHQNWMDALNDLTPKATLSLPVLPKASSVSNRDNAPPSNVPPVFVYDSVDFDSNWEKASASLGPPEPLSPPSNNLSTPPPPKTLSQPIFFPDGTPVRTENEYIALMNSGMLTDSSLSSTEPVPTLPKPVLIPEGYATTLTEAPDSSSPPVSLSSEPVQQQLMQEPSQQQQLKQAPLQQQQQLMQQQQQPQQSTTPPQGSVGPQIISENRVVDPATTSATNSASSQYQQPLSSPAFVPDSSSAMPVSNNQDENHSMSMVPNNPVTEYGPKGPLTPSGSTFDNYGGMPMPYNATMAAYWGPNGPPNPPPSELPVPPSQQYSNSIMNNGAVATAVVDPALYQQPLHHYTSVDFDEGGHTSTISSSASMSTPQTQSSPGYSTTTTSSVSAPVVSNVQTSDVVGGGNPTGPHLGGQSYEEYMNSGYQTEYANTISPSTSNAGNDTATYYNDTSSPSATQPMYGYSETLAAQMAASASTPLYAAQDGSYPAQYTNDTMQNGTHARNYDANETEAYLLLSFGNASVVPDHMMSNIYSEAANVYENAISSNNMSQAYGNATSSNNVSHVYGNVTSGNNASQAYLFSENYVAEGYGSSYNSTNSTYMSSDNVQYSNSSNVTDFYPNHSIDQYAENDNYMPTQQEQVTGNYSSAPLEEEEEVVANYRRSHDGSAYESSDPPGMHGSYVTDPRSTVVPSVYTETLSPRTGNGGSTQNPQVPNNSVGTASQAAMNQATNQVAMNQFEGLENVSGSIETFPTTSLLVPTMAPTLRPATIPLREPTGGVFFYTDDYYQYNLYGSSSSSSSSKGKASMKKKKKDKGMSSSSSSSSKMMGKGIGPSSSSSKMKKKKKSSKSGNNLSNAFIQGNDDDPRPIQVFSNDMKRRRVRRLP